jgi:hypothetical protein
MEAKKRRGAAAEGAKADAAVTGATAVVAMVERAMRPGCTLVAKARREGAAAAAAAAAGVATAAAVAKQENEDATVLSAEVQLVACATRLVVAAAATAVRCAAG